MLTLYTYTGKPIQTEMFKQGDRIHLKFPYNAWLKDEIKVMAGARWDPEHKTWSILNCPRNVFNLLYLANKDPFRRYDDDLPSFTPHRSNLYKHQLQIAAHVHHRRGCIVAAEMGTGKTLSLIEVMEQNPGNWLWVAPKATLMAMRTQFRTWNSRIYPDFVSYDSLHKHTSKVDHVVFDEASHLKNPTTNRFKEAERIVTTLRATNPNAIVALLTGTPAPKSPVDWWALAELACPGYIREGNIHKFKARLCIIEDRESSSGGTYPHLVTWLDDSAKCAICGNHANTLSHTDVSRNDYHAYKESINEVQNLHTRLKGLTYTIFKKDCLDLPPLRYERITIQPTPEALRLYNLILKKSKTAIEALVNARELSDGFQYKEVGTGQFTKCECVAPVQNDSGVPVPDYEDLKCPLCNGTGTKELKTRQEVEFPKNPKLDALSDLIQQHEEVGRLVTYAGFTASINRICKLAQQLGWAYIRVDGRGWHAENYNGEVLHPDNYEDLFQKSDLPRLLFIGHPGSAGMGLTLTASPSIAYYSNDFNGTSRIQSEARIHRIGTRGATIYDFLYLPTDTLILENLQHKRNLQSLTLGEVRENAASRK